MRIPISNIRAEFLPWVPDLNSFNEAMKKSVETDFYGVKVHVLGYDDLIRNKSVVNRIKDKQDIEELVKRKKSKKDNA